MVTGTVVVVVVVVDVVVVVVTGTVVVVVVVVDVVVDVVVAGTVVVVVDRGRVVLVVVAPRVVPVGATVLFVVPVVIGGLEVVTARVASGTVGVVMSVVPLTSVLSNAVLGPDRCTVDVVVVDFGEVVADPLGGAAGGAAATEVGDGENGTPVALAARTGASVGACE